MHILIAVKSVALEQNWLSASIVSITYQLSGPEQVRRVL